MSADFHEVYLTLSSFIQQTLDFASGFIEQKLDFAKSLAIIAGVLIALLNLKAQTRQRKIDNGFSLLDRFNQAIKPEDINLFKEIYLATYESAGAEIGHFAYRDEEGNLYQVPVAYLFAEEGSGPSLPLARLLTTDKDYTEVSLSSIRNMAEQLESLSYEVLKGQIEFRIIYYELGQIITVFERWIKIGLKQKDFQIEQDKNQDFDYLQLDYRFKNLLRMCKKYKRQIKRLPTKTIVAND